MKFIECCEKGYYDIARSTLMNPNFKGMKKTKGNYCFWLAYRNGHYSIAEIIISHPKFEIDFESINLKTFINAYNEKYAYRYDKMSPYLLILMEACKSGNLEAVKLIFNYPKLTQSVKEDLQLIFFNISCEYNHINIVKLILSDKFFNINIIDRKDNISTGFIYACCKNYIEIIKLILNDDRLNFYENETIKHGLYYAQDNDNILCVREFLKKGYVYIPDYLRLDQFESESKELIKNYLKNPVQCKKKLLIEDALTTFIDIIFLGDNFLNKKN